jgi:hypothetical protein
MKPPRCPICDTDHWAREPHRFATNGESATNNGATNAGGTSRSAYSGVEAGGAVVGEKAGLGEVVGAVRSVEPRTANRRSRADYNAYQREYMRKRRTS